MRALVSGATGFSGTQLCAALRSRGFDVRGISQRTENEWIDRADLGSSQSWAAALERFQPDYVFHLSGVAHAERLSDYVAHNTLAAAALLDAAAAATRPPSALLLAGTAAEYGLVPEERLPVSEDFPASPRTMYGLTKHAQTELGLEAARRGLRVVVVRPSNLIGPGMPLSTALGSFARQLREIELGRRPPELSIGDLTTSRDLIDVRDAVEVYVALVLHEQATGVFNVSSEREVVMWTVLEQLVDAFGLEVALKTDASRLRAVDVPRFSASRARLERLLGERTWTSLDDTLSAVVNHERGVGV